MSKIRKNIIILCLLVTNLFFLSSFVSADTNGFFVEYYSDQDLTEKIESGSKLKAGSYYIKIIQSGNAPLPNYISIDSEGTNNDVSNHVIENTGSGSFRYNRIINYDPLAIGIDPEVILINEQLPINNSDFYYTDTITPELDLEATLGESEDTYRLISNEALSYIEIKMSPTLYAILYKGHYKVGSTDYYGWHMVSKKGGMKITVIDIFAHSNEYTTFVDGSKITVMKNDEEDDFSIIVDGPVAQQIRAQNIVPLVVKDVAGNELETEFDLSDLLLKEEEGFLIFKDYIVGDDGIYLEYELNNSNGDKINIDDAKEIKRKIKGSDYFEDVDGFIVPVEEDREFIYIVLFDKIQYTVEVSFNGVNLLEIQKTGRIKTFQEKLYYEYSIDNFNLTGITLYEFGELNNIYNIVVNNLYFEINKEGSFSYYFNQNNNWYKFLINFENEPLPAPSLKSATFIEEQNSRRVSFEILSTGHDDVFVNKAILNIFNQGSLTPFITKTIESNLVKDTVYSFEIENNLLSKGTSYEYSITLENGYSSSTSPNKIFTVRPGDVSNVNITKLGENRIRITFTKGEGSSETIILNKDREVIYRGSATSYDYQLTSTDTFIYLIGTLTAYGTEFKSFNEVSVNVSGYFEEIPVITLPSIETLAATDITESSAKLKVEIKDKGNSDNLTIQLQYGTNPDNLTSTINLTYIPTQTVFEKVLSGLNSGTKYYYNFKVCNEAGCSYGNQLSFTTQIIVNAPSLKSATFIEEQNSRRVSFEILSTGHDDVFVNKAILNIFNQGSLTPFITKTIESNLVKDTVYSFEIENNLLSKGTSYEYSITLENGYSSSTSPNKIFTVRPGDVSNVNITKLGENRIRITFTKGEGSSETIILNKDREVIYRGSATSYDYQLTSTDTFIYLIGTLTAYGTEFKSFNEVSVNVSEYFEEIPVITLPSIETLAASDITESSAKLKVEIKDKGNSDNLTIQLQYGTNPDNLTSTVNLTYIPTQTVFEKVLSGLNSGTKYYYNFKVCNEAGCSYGNQLSFTTRIIVNAPSLKSATFIEEQNSRRVSFEILSTGHDDVFVNKAILNIFNQGSLTPFITKTIESNLVKDTVYSFEIENNLLSKGTSYEYSITLENGYSSSTSPNKIFTVRPGDVTNVNITKLGENRIRITFTKGEGSSETIILNKDREVIYRGSATSYDYQLTSTDTFIYLIGTLTAYGTEFKSFNEVSVNVSGYFEEIPVITLPSIETLAATDITESSAKLKVEIKDKGNSDNLTIQLQYGTNPDNLTSTINLTYIPTQTVFEKVLSGLNSGTKYYYNFKVCNEAGCSYGNQLSFTTQIIVNAPSLKSATFIEEQNSRRVSFEILSTGHDDVFVNKAILNIFNQGSLTPFITKTIESNLVKDTVYSFEIENNLLSKGTSYEYSITLENGYSSSTSPNKIFTVRPGDVSNVNITKLGENRIRITFTKGEGSSETIILNKDREVIYRGSATSYDYQLTSTDTFIYLIGTLTAYGTEFKSFNEVSVNVSGYFEEIPVITLPSIETLAATDITESSAKLKVEIKDKGNSDNLTIQLQYGTNPDNLTSTINLTYIPTQTVFEKVLSGLNSGTKYYYNFKVCNEAGCSYGNQLSFTTQIIVNAPSLKSATFIEEQNSRRVSFEILSTGHDDVFVNKAILNIFNQGSLTPFITKTIESNLVKDTVYSFEIENNLLSKGTSYEYSITLENGYSSSTSPNKIFTVRPGDVSNVNITKLGENRIRITFTKGEGSSETIILNKDREVIYRGSATSYDYQLTSTDTFIYLIGTLTAYGTEFKSFNEVSVNVSGYFEEIPVITLPSIETLAASDITESSAKLKVEIKDKGNSDNLTIQLQYGTNPDNLTSTVNLTYIPTQTVFEKVLSGLNSGTKYYYNFKVCNEAGCSYGNQLSFTTRIIVNAPSLKSATFIEERNSRRVSFEILSTGHDDVFVNKAILNIFNQGSLTPFITKTIESNLVKDTVYSFEIENNLLSKGTSYEYSITLENGYSSSTSPNKIFTVRPGDVTNVNITKLGENRIRITFTKGEGSSETIILNKDREVIYRGSATSYDYQLTSTDTFIYLIGTLTAYGTEFKSFNEVSVNVSGYFEEIPVITLPSIETLAASDITESSAKLKVEIKDKGNSDNLTIQLQYGTNPDNLTSTINLTYIPTQTVFEKVLSGLNSGTKYYYNFKVCNEAGCSYGNQLSFTTQIIVNAPSLKSATFIEEQNSRRVSFEILSTGHDDVFVNKAILNIFNQGSLTPFITKTIESNLVKDTVYSFEIENNLLSKGTSYEYSITLENGYSSSTSPNKIFTVRPGDVSNVNITKLGENRIRITFTKGEGSSETIILNKDREVIYRGSATSYDYQLTSTDTFIYLIGTLTAYGTEFKSFNEVSVNVSGYFEEIPVITLPSIETLAATDITESSAKLKVEIKDKGNSDNLTIQLQYGTNPDNLTSTINLTYIPTQTVFEKVLSGLNSGTKYYYNFKVCNEAGCSYGNQLSFTTQIIVNAPSLKSATFIEEQNSRRVSFEILSTGHDDVFVNKAILNIFNQGSLTPFITKTIESNLVKDTVYSFEIENNLLSKGTSYEYSITLENGYSSSTSPNKIFTVRPGDVSNVNITKLGENRIRITFTKGEGSSETIILNKDREVIYRGSATSYDYQLTSTDTFIYLIGTLTAYGTEFKSFNEVSVNVSGYFEYLRMGEFNNSPNDYPLMLGNHTQSGGSQNWTSNLSNVNLGDELRFSVYYHNGSSIVAKDTKVELSFNYSQSYCNLNSKISAEGFNDYNSQANIYLKPNQFIKLQGTGKWYSNYNGNNYMIRDIFYTVENNKVIFSLGDVYPSYAPNDGYIIFNAIVTNNP